MNSSPRPARGTKLTRWLPHLERLEARETPAVTIGLSDVATWTELGPNVISGGQTRGITAPDPNGGGNVSNPVIGAVQALAAHPTNPNIMFAAGPNGGVWRTTSAQDANPVWTPISDQLASLSVSDMYLDPDNPNRLLVGFGGTADGADVDGTGVLRGDLIGLVYTENALDPTPTWTILNNNLANKNITNVYLRAAAGGNPAYMLVGTDQGLYRSNDGGQTFTNVFTFTTNNGVTYGTRAFAQGVFDLAENPRLRNQFYVATRSGGGLSTHNVWRTDDGGLTWGTVTDSQMQLNGRTVNVQITVRDVNAVDNQVYVAVSNNNPQPGAEQSTPGIGYRYGWQNRLGVLSSVTWSTNQGGNWTRMDAPRQLTDELPIISAVADSSGVVTINTGVAHRLQTDDLVRIDELFDVPPPAVPPALPIPPSEILEGYWTITVTGSTSFTLNGAVFTGAITTQSPGEDANWSRVVGATAGENGEFLQILADRVEEELVYLGGDMSQWNFFNSGGSPGPTTFTGSYWVGDRLENPQGDNELDIPGGQGNSAQWTTLTDRGTANVPRTAPGADTREMIFDANGNLWVGTGSGVFRRTTLDTAGSWVSANGNLRLGQFWSTSFDDYTDTSIGAMQDTGQVEQNPTGLGWRSLLENFSFDPGPPVVDPFDRNDLTDQESAYTTFVDNSLANHPSPALRRSVRYALGSNFQSVTRTIVAPDGGGTPTIGNPVFLTFASPATPGVPYSGISGADLANTANANVVLALNANDTARGVYGLNNVYEDSDPDGVTGRLVENVTPGGMTGVVRAMAYGGKRAGTTFNQILFVGTSTGQLWIRGEFGVSFQLRGTGGSGPITDIELDPDDWRHAFVLQGNRIYETTDAGVTFTDVSANLSTAPSPTTGLPTGNGLTTQVRTIALYDPNPGAANVGADGDVIILAGGRGGVYRRTLSVCGTTTAWAEYGQGLPNTVVQDLEVIGNRLLAGTFGRGSWVIDDVAPTLTNALYLEVTGDAAADTIRLEADPNDPNAVFVDDGLGTRQRFQFGQFDAIRITAGAGADRVYIDSNGAAAGGTARFVNFPVEVHMGGDAGDMLVINAEGETTAVQATVTDNTVGAGTGDTIFSGCGSVSFTGLANGVLWVATGSGNDRLIAAGTPLIPSGANPLPQTTMLRGGEGDDSYSTDGTAAGIIVVNDSAGVADNLVVNVPLNGIATVDGPNRGITVGTQMVVFDAGIDWAMLDGVGGVATANWLGGATGEGVYVMRDQFDPANSQILYAGMPLRLRGMTAVSVNTLGGGDTVQVDSNGLAAGGDVNFVRYALSVNLGGEAGDLLVVNDMSEAAATTVGVTASTIGATPGVDDLFGAGGSLSYTGLSTGSGLQLYTGGGNDRIRFDAATTLYALVQSGGGADELEVLGSSANDVVGTSPTGLGANGRLAVNTFGVEVFSFLGAGGADVLAVLATAGSDAVTLAHGGPLAGAITGLPVAVRFDAVERVYLDAAGGVNSLTWEDRSGGVYGTAVAPTTGHVFAPSGTAAGEMRFAGGAGTVTQFGSVNGGFVVNGDPTGNGSRDVLTVLGVSSAAAGATDGEWTAANGSDAITVNDAGVGVTNASLGTLRSVTFGNTPAGANSFATVYVKGGNEIGTGDAFTAATTARTNLLLDGGNPSTPPGDTLALTTQGRASAAVLADGPLGPTHTRVTDLVGGRSAGHRNFEGVTATFINPTTGQPVSSFGAPQANLFAAATDTGVPVQVRVYNLDGSPRFTLTPFGGFAGGARVAVGDVTGDGNSDVVVGAGPGAAPHVKVYDGTTGAEVASFFAYHPAFTGGVSVATGYFNSDGRADIVIGAGAGGGPHVKVVDGASGGELLSFFAYDPGFTNGVNVAAGDFSGDGRSDLVVGAGAGGGPHVKVFDGTTAVQLHSFFAFDPAFAGGVNVAAGDLTGDGRADVIAGAGFGGSAHVVAYDGATGGGPIRSFIVNDPSFPGQPPINLTSGVRVSAADLDGDGLVEVLTGRGPGSRPFAQFLKVSARSGGTVLPVLQSVLAVNTFGDAYSGGIWVGG